MKLYTNPNNTATLKLLFAANLSRKTVELAIANHGDPIFSGPKYLPLLVVNEELSFFSSNAAAQYLLPVSDDLRSQCEQLQELEATRLYPLVQTIVSSKNVAADWKQVLTSILKDLDGVLEKKKYLLCDTITIADATIWATIYPLYQSKDHKQLLNEYGNVSRWFTDVNNLKEAQEAVKQWNGNPEGPLGQCSSMGLPAIPSLASSAGSPEQVVATGPSADELALAKDLWEKGFEALPSLIKQEKVILPVKGRKNVLITSALPYVNNVPHLGNIIGCVLSADIFARYARLCNYNVLFVCGTDEYGTATETKALEEGVTPRQICDKYYAIHRDVYKWFNISFDHFGRTSTPEQTQITQKMFMKLEENGFISKQSVEQLHCENCNRFLADRFVEGTCHHPGCLYDNARGDQCDKCGKLINAVELIAPRCKVCGNTPVKKASEQFFLELGQLEGSVHTWAMSSSVGWSACARAVCRGWLREGLRPRAITRDLNWGVPLPKHHPGNKVFYVWFDAPMGYMSITECATKQYEKWWKPDKEYNVKLYQFMAKDNVPFHAVMFPATLLGVNEGHTLVSHLYATEYLNYEEGKFSKSRGVGVFGTDAQDTGIPSDVWRFYLASIRPEGSDSSFSWTELGTRNNSELLNNLGNFCHRSLSFCYTSFKGVVPDVAPTQSDYELMALINREVKAYVEQMERGRLREALRHVLLVGKLGNGHMQASQPWVLLKGSDEDRTAAATAINICCQIASLLCVLLSPYMPDTSKRLSEQLNLNTTALRINLETPSLLQYLKKGHKINKPEPLFTKIEPDTLEGLRKKYAGTQTDRKNAESAQNSVSTGAPDISGLEAAIAAQGEKVRQLKSSTKDKAVWQPEVNKLLDLKKQLENLQKNPESTKIFVSGAQGIPNLEAAIAAQGEKVRQLKSSTKDKAVWQPEVNKLLDLKKQLAILQQNAATKQAPVADDKNAIADLEAAIAKQGDKVRQLKGSTKDKSVWQPEVNILLELKKQLSALQVSK